MDQARAPDTRVSGLVFALALIVYAITASPAIGWLDAPEFVAASVSLGIAHSPGHPLVAMLGKLGTLIPLGDAPFRVNLVSALCGAAAASCFFNLMRRVLAAALPRSPRSATLMAASLALLVAFSWAAWFQSIRAEVYALEAALAIAALSCALAYARGRRARHLMLFGLLGAAAAANHPAIAAPVILAGGAAVLWRRPPARHLALGATLTVLGLATLAYLPARSAAHPEPDFAAPHTAGRFAFTVSGRAFHKTAGAVHVSSRGEDTAEVVAAIAGALTAPIAVLALVGLAMGAADPRHRGAAATLGAVIALAAAARVILGFDPATPDHLGYLVPAIACAAALAGLGLALLCAWVERGAGPRVLAAPIAAAALALVVPIQLGARWGEADLSGASASSALAHFEAADPPPRALVLTAYFETHFRLMALRAVEGARPDMVDLDRSFLTYPGMAAEARRRHPELADLIDAPLAAGAPSPLAKLDALARRRPVLVELHPNVEPALDARLVPTGAFAAYLPGAPGKLLDAAEHRSRRVAALLERRLASVSAADRERARLALLWRDYLLTEHYCERGRRVAAVRAYRRALARAPRDASLAALARRCDLKEAAR